ncbi:histone deacetylase [Candidatus Solincola sp.]|nr:histone deacetylase [Actinomycetota bacterium]MDI7253373.1 histone deacetylase [Actinomycetota bacterium]
MIAGGERCRLVVVYHPDFATQGYPALRERIAPAFEELKSRGILEREGVHLLEARPAEEKLAEEVHTEGHIQGVKRSGYYQVALLSAGSVIMGAEEVASGRAEAAFCFTGTAGHHASRDGFWGFCYLNDVAMTLVRLRRKGGGRRVAVVDIDPHFGDGTRDLLGDDPEVLHVNFHSGYVIRDSGGPHNLDLALPHDAGDAQFLHAVDRAVEAAEEFRPELLFVVFGHDSHRDDYGAFELSGGVYREFALRLRRSFPSGVIYVLSGGARPHVARQAIGDVVEVLAGRRDIPTGATPATR